MLDVAIELFDFSELVVTDALLDVVLELDVVVIELEDFVLEELIVEELAELVELDVLLVDAPQLITAV